MAQLTSRACPEVPYVPVIRQVYMKKIIKLFPPTSTGVSDGFC